ncbi:MAG TPA: hypothetical protein VEF04_10640 [Blastocatellia bacterium]|nr:hypothetical protein [Blastocatellia bacterium]
MSGARLIKRKDVEQCEKQERLDPLRIETQAPSFDAMINWRSKYQTSRPADPRAAFSALFNNQCSANSQD